MLCVIMLKVVMLSVMAPIGFFLAPSSHCSIPIDQGILKGGSVTIPFTSCLTGLESAL
jgi:hypothetical protein